MDLATMTVLAATTGTREVMGGDGVVGVTGEEETLVVEEEEEGRQGERQPWMEGRWKVS